MGKSVRIFVFHVYDNKPFTANKGLNYQIDNMLYPVNAIFFP
jgi:hypothetical protein